jgi:AGCS family alanine or glycine:cation symporter
VIIGGIKRIGSVASKLVPFMCGLYLIAGILVLLMNFSVIPEIIMEIFKYGLGFGNASASGAFLGGTFG